MTPFHDLRFRSGMTIASFSRYFGLCYRTAISWETGTRNCPAYLLALMEYKLCAEGLIT